MVKMSLPLLMGFHSSGKGGLDILRCRYLDLLYNLPKYLKQNKPKLFLAYICDVNEAEGQGMTLFPLGYIGLVVQCTG